MVERAASFPDSFQGLVRACSSFYKNNLEKIRAEHVCQTRSNLSGFARVFHEQCGTLTPSVKKRLEDLGSGNCVVLMTAHQPNFFAYNGVFRKATLSFVLSEHLSRILGVPVVNFFGIADQDFTDDRWVRSCQLPAVQKSEGTLAICVKLPERMMLCKVAKPSEELLRAWESQIGKWISETVNSVSCLLKKAGLGSLSKDAETKLGENFKSLWGIVEECYERSVNFSDFNAFLLSKVINEVWGYDTLFARFSECQQAFDDDFGYLLSRFDDYSSLLKEASELPCQIAESEGVTDQEPLLVPFWYHCDCGSKAKLLMRNEGESLAGHGTCMKCGRFFTLDFGSKSNPRLSGISSRVSARAIAMNLVFFRGLLPCVYVGGVGGARYLTEALHVADGLGIPFAPIAIWRPHDRYLGVGQFEALLERKRICSSLGVHDPTQAQSLLEAMTCEARKTLDSLELEKRRLEEELEKNPDNIRIREEIVQTSVARTRAGRTLELSVLANESRILRNAAVATDLMPSIIDYAVNIGLEETSQQWRKHLEEKGDLTSDVQLASVLNRSVNTEIERIL